MFVFKVLVGNYLFYSLAPSLMQSYSFLYFKLNITIPYAFSRTQSCCMWPCSFGRILFLFGRPCTTQGVDPLWRLLHHIIWIVYKHKVGHWGIDLSLSYCFVLFKLTVLNTHWSYYGLGPRATRHSHIGGTSSRPSDHEDLQLNLKQGRRRVMP